jgi:hypothetical protein
MGVTFLQCAASTVTQGDRCRFACCCPAGAQTLLHASTTSATLQPDTQTAPTLTGCLGPTTAGSCATMEKDMKVGVSHVCSVFQTCSAA